MGGNYSLDFLRYLIDGTKRYDATGIASAELSALFGYNELDRLRQIKPSKVLNEKDRDDIYQLYVRNYLSESKGNTSMDNLADFYIWMAENRCYLMDMLVGKINRLYKAHPSINPFRKEVYRLDAMAYLYNRRLVSTYNRSIKMEYNEEHQILVLPKNDHRIRR
jgi:hypothetical protein